MKMLASAAFGLAIASVPTGWANAQDQAPIGHRQPTAQTVPQNDTSFGMNPTLEGRSAAKASAKTSKSKNGMNADVGFPDICANCND